MKRILWAATLGLGIGEGARGMCEPTLKLKLDQANFQQNETLNFDVSIAQDCVPQLDVELRVWVNLTKGKALVEQPLMVSLPRDYAVDLPMSISIDKRFENLRVYSIDVNVLEGTTGSLLGHGKRLFTVGYPNFGKIGSVAAGESGNTCVVFAGEARCWGENSAGQLGQGDKLDRNDPSQIPAIDLGGVAVVQIGVGSGRICALLVDGGIKCWGANLHFINGGKPSAQYLGDEPGEMGSNLAYVDLGKDVKALQISVGRVHSCAILDDHTIKCWGLGGFGDLGTGDKAPRTDPSVMGDNLKAVDLGKGRHALQVSTGARASCALLDNLTVKCWGWNDSGQLGQGDTRWRGLEPNQMGDQLPPIDLGTGRYAVSVKTSSDYTTCAILDDQTLKCWGNGRQGRLGTGEASLGGKAGEMGDNLAPLDFGKDRKVLQVNDTNSCVLLDNLEVKCWGGNVYGRLGSGAPDHIGDQPGEMGDLLKPVDLGTNLLATQVAGSIIHSCAILTDDSLKCWGRNASGQLGIGDTVDRGDRAGTMGDQLPAIHF